MTKFHINKHGVPAACHYPIDLCQYGDKSTHFETYEEAKEYSEKVLESVKGNVVLEQKHPSQKIRSYYFSSTAINEFYKNKKVANIPDFDLVIISWLTMDKRVEDMKENKVCGVSFTYGDITRMMEEELKLKTGKNLNVEKFLEVYKKNMIEEQMKVQKNLYENTALLSKELKLDSMEIIYLPMKARKLLEKDGFMSNAENVNEVIYKVSPEVSKFGNIVSYNHSTNKVSKEYDAYEIAGVLEGKTLYELCYISNRKIFEEAWNKKGGSKTLTFETALEKYKEKLFFKGLEGLDVPRALIRMSPLVAKNISEFVVRYRAIMGAIGEILGDENVLKNFDEEEDWIIE